MKPEEDFRLLDFFIGLWFVASMLTAGVIAGYAFPTIESDSSGNGVEVFAAGPMLAGFVVAAIANTPVTVFYVLLKRLVRLNVKKARYVAP